MQTTNDRDLKQLIRTLFIRADPKLAHYLKLLNITNIDSDRTMLLQDIDRLVRTCSNQHRRYVKELQKSKKIDVTTILQKSEYQNVLKFIALTKNAIVDPYAKFNSHLSPYLDGDRQKIQFIGPTKWISKGNKSQPMREEHNSWGCPCDCNETIKFYVKLEHFSQEAQQLQEENSAYKICVGGFWWQRTDGFCNSSFLRAKVLNGTSETLDVIAEKEIEVFQQTSQEPLFKFLVKENGHLVSQGFADGSQEGWIKSQKNSIDMKRKHSQYEEKNNYDLDSQQKTASMPPNSEIKAPEIETYEQEGYTVPGFVKDGSTKYNQIKLEFPMRRGQKFGQIVVELRSHGSAIFKNEENKNLPYGPVFTGLYTRIIPNTYEF